MRVSENINYKMKPDISTLETVAYYSLYVSSSAEDIASGDKFNFLENTPDFPMST